jgi:acetoin utilization protein AcuC
MSPPPPDCKVSFLWSESLETFNFGSKHPIQPGRFQKVHDFFAAQGFFDLSTVQKIAPVPLSLDLLKRVHAQDYLDMVKTISETGIGDIDIDTPGFKGIFDNSRITSGATVTGIDAIAKGVVDHCISPTGGFHHAFYEKGGGFCIFNDVAASVYHLKDLGYERILIADFDVHHGNGTQKYFYDDPGVMQISFHESPEWIFPHDGFIKDIGAGAGAGYNINMPFPMDSGDGVYRYAFDELVPPLIDFYQPEFIIFLPGIDAHYKDRLAHLVLTTDLFRYIAEVIHDAAHRHSDGRLCALAGGGYHPESFLWGMGVVMSVLTGHPYNPPEQNPPFQDDEETWAEVKRDVAHVKDAVFTTLGL